MAEPQERKSWMEALAQAPVADLKRAYQALNIAPAFSWLRAPESGAVMVRGRMGGTGGPFNLGEMTVTRCSLRLTDGTVGHAYVAGRDKERAEIAALCDALLQGSEAVRIRDGVLKPLRNGMAQARAQQAGKAAATKVEFFTMVRGES